MGRKLDQTLSSDYAYHESVHIMSHIPCTSQASQDFMSFIFSSITAMNLSARSLSLANEKSGIRITTQKDQ